MFHSSVAELLSEQGHVPFAVVADPEKRLYAEFGVESSARALLDPRAWLPGAQGALRKLRQRRLRLPDLGGPLGLPADFLIASDGRVLARKYGAYAYDQWSVDELLVLASEQHENLSPGSTDEMHLRGLLE